ncbi:MAG: DNA primase [Deltaproteobacteria bacterium]|nr:DNA primase [Deltaproteobacteria bacterium]
MIPEGIISEIRNRTDIVALVSEHVKLKRTGANYVGICPFHPDKTPSFSVHRARQFFHCFGCHVSGDAISFVMRIENLSFMEAVRILAKRANIEIEEISDDESRAQQREKAQKERLFALSQIAADFYHEQLQSHPSAEIAQRELRKRNVSSETVKKFHLGYAPDGWDELSRFIAEKRLSLSEAEQVGLIIPRRSSSGYYDRFRGRLIFPVFDTHGRVVAFSGRALDHPAARTDKQEPKYVNSPESPLYKKGSILFGLYQNRVAIRRNGWAVLCEGNFDLLALFQAGVINAVAPLGTAFTLNHAYLIRRFAQRLTVLFDGDAAGRKAVRSIYPFLVKAGLSARVVNLPAGDDPDSFIRTKGAEALIRLIEGSAGIVETIIDETAESALRQAADIALAIRQLGPIIAEVQSPVERHKYIDRVAQRFEIRDLRSIYKELRAGARGSAKGEERTTSTKKSKKSSVPTGERRDNLSKLQGDLLGILLDFPELFDDPKAKKLEELLTNEQLRVIFHTAETQTRATRDLSASTLLDQVETQIGNTSAYLWLQERLAVQKYDSVVNAREALDKGVPVLRKQYIESKVQSLTREIQVARRSGDENRAIELTKQRYELWRSAPNS